MFSQNRKRSAVAAIILITVFLASLLIENADLPFGICILKTVTGIPCPSCGMTHSFVSIGHLRIYDGFLHNIMGPFLYLLMLSGILITLLEIFLDRLIIYPFFKRYERSILSVVLISAAVSWCYNIFRFIKG